MEITKILEKHGLSSKQVALYLACLKLGSSSVYKIAKIANLPRSTSYEGLEVLKKRKLVSSFRKKNIIYYNAESPNQIIEQAKEKVNLLENVLPELNSMYSSIKKQPTIRLFEGADGMKVILKEIVNEAKEIKGFSSAENMFSVLVDYWPIYLQKRIKNKIPAKILYSESPKARERKRLGPQQLREVRILPKKYKLQGLVVIWNDKVGFFTFSEKPIAVIIASRELAQTQKILFDFIWESLE